MLQRSLNVGVSPLYWLIIPRAAACGTGIVKVMGLWNFLLRGSTVTMGETATRLPNNFTTSSGWIGWAYYFFLHKCQCRGEKKKQKICVTHKTLSWPIISLVILFSIFSFFVFFFFKNSLRVTALTVFG